MTRMMFLSALLALTACGGGGDTGTNEPFEGEAEAEAEGEGEVATGSLVIGVMPEMTEKPPGEFEIDGVVDVVNAVMPGSELTITLAEGEHEIVPHFDTGNGVEYGYAVVGEIHEPATGWTLEVSVDAGQTVEAQFTLCHPLDGTWMTDTRQVEVTTRAEEDGKCGTLGFPLFNFEIEGDQVRSYNGAGPWAPILDNGNRIEYEGFVFVRL